MKCVAVVGAGAIGQLVAHELAVRGHAVTLVSRSGVRAEHPNIRTVMADATDPQSLIWALTQTAVDSPDRRDRGQATGGCDVVVNALNPGSYTRWAKEWPPMAEGVMATCKTMGAGQVIIGNLYAYGQVTGPMDEGSAIAPNGVKGELRAGMWSRALALHQAGGPAAVEIRASDYFGAAARPGVSVLMDYVIDPVARGKRAWVPLGDLEAPHSWTYLPDIARLAADVAESDPQGPRWGRAWHVPTSPPRSMRQVADDVGSLPQVQTPAGGVRIHRLPTALLTLGRVHPFIRALDETRHQFEGPWELDSTAAQEEFGWSPTPWAYALEESVLTRNSSPAGRRGAP